jgi:integrase
MLEFLGDVMVRAITVDDLSNFRESWTVGPTTAKNTIERMRSFFKFCVEPDWIERNPAKLIAPPKILSIERRPYEPEEIKVIDEAIDEFPNWGIYGEMNREHLRAFVAVLKWTGMRIGDAVQLSQEKVAGGHITLYTTKNGKRVSVPIHPEIEVSLGILGRQHGFYFWSGEGTIKSQVSCWERTFKRLSKIAKLRVFAHGFRHTLIVNLLSKGIPISEVAIIVGNSPRIIERYYNHHIKSRQTAIDQMFMGTW